ncbi:MAG: hypothetical protein Q7S40_32030 [Opitutaceae bacterium]|nr:hypothetical protein [Opitutaceae bacterium]
MKLDRITYEPGALVDFFEKGLTASGALCARTWHDRLEVVAEGPAARLWNADGALHSVELQFAPVGASGARAAGREVFPGCPLTFQLAEALRPAPLALERVVLAADGPAARPPDATVVERLWRNQFPDTVRWRQAAPLARDFHFSLVALVRCEIQAIDQHWSLHRVALALPGGQSDEGLAREIGFARVDESGPGLDAWPVPDPAEWSAMLSRVMEQELAGELADVRVRQENRLRRELDRVDDYFENYERELSERVRRGGKVKLADRLAAARAEHARHRADQVARHEIVVVPHLDTLLLVAEPAWRAALHVARAHQPPADVTARFIPRARRWELGRL